MEKRGFVNRLKNRGHNSYIVGGQAMSLNDGGFAVEMGLLFLFLLIMAGGGIFVYCFVRDMGKLVKEISSYFKKRKTQTEG